MQMVVWVLVCRAEPEVLRVHVTHLLRPILFLQLIQPVVVRCVLILYILLIIIALVAIII